MATFFDQRYCGRPCLLLLLWTFGILSMLFLLFGMMLDDLTRVSFEVQQVSTRNIEYDIKCGSSKYSITPGNQNTEYIDNGETEAVLQKQAGDGWLAFGILACLMIPFLLFGIITDYYAGKFDNKKPIDYFKACCLLQTWGFTRIGALFMLIFELFQIIIYAATDKCKSEEFYKDVANQDVDLVNWSPIGGASFGFVIMSLILLIFLFGFMLYYQYMISAELPTGEEKKAPVNFQMYPDGVERPTKTAKEPTPPPIAPSNQAPQSEYFQPKKNVTAGYDEGGNTKNDQDLGLSPVNEAKKPKGPPPLPPPK